jgi:hypothetical protein
MRPNAKIRAALQLALLLLLLLLPALALPPLLALLPLLRCRPTAAARRRDSWVYRPPSAMAGSVSPSRAINLSSPC